MKLKNPYGSVSAIGKFAKIGIFSRWKDVTIFKKYTPPNQPMSSFQVAQQKKYGLARLAYNNTPFTDRDMSALRLFSSTFKVHLNPFQFICWLYLLGSNIYPTPPLFYNCDTHPLPNGRLRIYITSITGLDLTVLYSPTRGGSTFKIAMPEIGGSGTYRVTIPGLISGHRYYFFIADTFQRYSPAHWQYTYYYQDNFNDGNFNGWNVTAGVWTAAPFYLFSNVDGSFIRTNANVVPAGEKYFYYKHKHHGVGLPDSTSRYHPVWQDANNKLTLQFDTRPLPQNSYAFVERIGGAPNLLHYSHKYDYAGLAGTWFHIIVYKNGIIGKFKIWKDGESEPLLWDWEGNYNPLLIDTGKIACHASSVDVNGCGYDDTEVFIRVWNPELPLIKGLISGLYYANSG